MALLIISAYTIKHLQFINSFMTNGCTNDDTVCVIIIMVIGNRRFKDDCLPIEISMLSLVSMRDKKRNKRYKKHMQHHYNVNVTCILT